MSFRGNAHFDKDIRFQEDKPTITDFGATLGFGYRHKSGVYILPELGYQRYKFRHDPAGSIYRSQYLRLAGNLGYMTPLNCSKLGDQTLWNSYSFFRYKRRFKDDDVNGRELNYVTAEYSLGLSSGLMFKLFGQSYLSTNLSLYYRETPDRWDSRRGINQDTHFTVSPEFMLIIGLGGDK
jgi:hypothetical protein